MGSSHELPILQTNPSLHGVFKVGINLHSVPENTLMVGDSEYDLQAAKRAGVKSAGVAWSLKGEACLNKYQPDYMLHDMRDLLPIVGINEG